MTKEAYFEMCEMLGSEPLESEIPLELEDFPDLVQQAFVIYSMLSDIWEGMSGTYLGKDYSLLFDLFELYSIDTKEEKLLSTDFIKHIDSVRSKLLSEKQKATKPAS
jgi:hypothetical protein